MEAAFIDKSFSGGSLREAVAAFFGNYTPDSAKVLFWQLFQCWARKDCKELVSVSDEEVALFFDQLMDLVAAAHIEHEANRVRGKGKPGGGDD